MPCDLYATLLGKGGEVGCSLLSYLTLLSVLYQATGELQETLAACQNKPETKKNNSIKQAGAD